MYFKNDKELFNYVRTYSPDNIKNNYNFFNEYNFKYVSIDTVLKNIFNDNICVIDVRSPAEYEETCLPNAVNIPVLNNSERHYTGLVYKKYSKNAVFELAKEFAEIKKNDILNFLSSNKNKNLYAYCWRGGGRSKYFAYMAMNAGINVKLIKGGIKSYRHKVNKYFSGKPKFDLLELNGLTGCGKTKIIKSMINVLPILDFEDAARHYSSLFGYVPYKIRNVPKIKNQSAFENNLYSQIIRNKYYFPTYKLFLAESESKKVGDFFIPEIIYNKLQKAYSITITTTLDKRIRQLKKEYFYNEQGLNEMMKIFKEKEMFFRREMSSKYYDEALEYLNKNKTEEFIEIMLLKYYDLKYFDKGKKPLAVINSDVEDVYRDEIKFIYTVIANKNSKHH